MGVSFDLNTLLIAGAAVLLGYQLVIFAVFTKIFAISEGLHPPHTHLYKSVFRGLNLEMGILAGFVLTVSGIVLAGLVFLDWRAVEFGQLAPQVMVRRTLLALLLMVIGTQTIFSSFFLGVLTLRRKRLPDQSLIMINRL